MTREEIKEKAKENLKGRWTNIVIFVLIYMLSTYLISYVSQYIPFVGPIGYSILSVTMLYIFAISFVKYKREENVGLVDIFTKIPENFVASWKVVGGVLLRMLPYVISIVVIYFVMFVGIGMAVVGAIGESSIAMIIGIILGFICMVALIVLSVFATVKGLYYSLAQYIMYDSGNALLGKEAADKSKELMEGHRAELFVLSLSFIGWGILAVLTLGIGFLWLAPYMQISTVIFYESLVEKNVEGKKEEVIEENVDPIQ